MRLTRQTSIVLLIVLLVFRLHDNHNALALTVGKLSLWGLASPPSCFKRRGGIVHPSSLRLFAAIQSDDDDGRGKQQQKQQETNSVKKGYKFGDFTKGLLKTATSAINEVTGKESYEFGDLSKWLDQQAKAQVANLTGRDEYQFGDLTQWTGAQMQQAVFNFTGKEDYQAGDISKEIVRRVSAGEYKTEDILLAIKILLALGANFTPVAAALPTKVLLELFDYSVAQEVGDKALGVLATSLDQRFKSTLTGDANYQLGDRSKKALAKALANYTGKEKYEFGDISRLVAS